VVRRAIGLWLIAFGVWQAGCNASDARRPTASVSPDSGAAPDAGEAGESDAAPDSAVVRGDAPVWPEAEQELELPYGGPALSVLLVVDASPSALDVHLNVDTTSSMRFAIDELQFALKSNLIDRVRARVADVAFGVSRYADFPLLPYGYPGSETGEGADQPFVLLAPITTNVDRVLSAVNRLDLPLGFGGDIPEASAEALYQVATGAGYVLGRQRFIERKPTLAATGGGTLGGVGFRDYALHVVLHVADSPAHTPEDYLAGGLPDVHSMTEASMALRNLGVRVVSIMPTDCENDECRAQYPYEPTRTELETLSLNTEASFAADRGKCPTGIAQASLPAREDRCPLVYDVRSDGSGLSRTISDAVLALLQEVRFGEVHADTSNDRLQFIQSVRAEPVDQPSGVRVPDARDLLPRGEPDGVIESYVDVDRRSQLGFRVTLQNQSIAARDVAQRFRVAVQVVGDGVLLEERLLRVVVPAQGGNATDPESSRHVAVDAAVEATADAGS
jgi:hypothetical protein